MTSPKRALIVYDPIGGPSETTAKAVADALLAEGLSVTLKSVHVTEPADVAAHSLLVVGTWVTPLLFLQIPSHAILHFVASLPSLEGKRAAIFTTELFGAGHVVAKLQEALTHRQAEVVGLHQVRAFAPEAGAREFAQLLIGG